MKRYTIMATILMAVLFFASGVWAVNKVDISNTVSGIVTEINNGKDAKSFKADQFSPYAFIMQEDGNLLVHPSLAGQSLKEKAPVVYTALLQATPKGVWVEYQWQGKLKHTFAQTTKNNLIVGSGY